MGLHKTYPRDFERVYEAYPKWPKGRTKKHEAFKKFEQVKREDQLTPKDIDELITIIDKMVRMRKSWQRGDPYGPKGLQHFLHGRLWDDEYVEKTPVFSVASVIPEPAVPVNPAKAERAIANIRKLGIRGLPS